MVPEIPGLQGRRDSGDNTDVLRNLWEAVPFPRLPIDAPARLKDLTIDIHDPRRVLGINRASRRHSVQTLIERYVAQIQFGCGNKSCSKPTCFSSRKKIAAGAPIRRYNATSARTLAVYLASQDNPEQGLCVATMPSTPPFLSTPPQIPLRKSVTISTRDMQHRKLQDGNDRSSKSLKSDLRKGAGASSTSKKGNNETDLLIQGARDDPTTKNDPRSFVQNVFGTVAFRMLEWLTPRILEAGSMAQELEARSNNADTAHKASDTKQVSNEGVEQDKNDNVIEINPEGETNGNKKFEKKPSCDSVVRKEGEPVSRSTEDTATNPRIDKPDNTLESESSISEELKDSLTMASLKSLNNCVHEMAISKPEPKLSSGQFATSPNNKSADVALLSSGLPPCSLDAKVSLEPDFQNLAYVPEESVILSKLPNLSAQASRQVQEADLPQSLSSLPIDVIDLICDILQVDNTYEEHSLYPQNVPAKAALKRIPLNQIACPYPSSLKAQWRLFIDQSVFDVLSHHDSLLRSFSNERHVLYDSQTLWWLMIKMTRIAPSLVFHSLWNAASTLLDPPWPASTASRSRNVSTSKVGVSNVVAARVLIICLHTLVAALPVIYGDQHHLANMSRTRSYGLTMPGRSQIDTAYQARLCLLYDDVFTNDLALRLARRIFTSIPTRRRFTKETAHQTGFPEAQCPEPDILETVLSSLDFGSPSVLSIPDAARELHQAETTILILEWARTVMLQDWKGAAEVPADGAFGGALALIAAIYKKRKSLLVGDIYFRTQFFAERLDIVVTPVEWLSFSSNENTIHLLDHPYLFDPSTLVNYFRAINFSRMNEAYETAKAKSDLIRVTAADHLITNRESRLKLEDRLKIATTQYLVLQVRRESVLLDTFNSMWRREQRDLLRPLKIHLGEEMGEEGIDYGGVQQEFFRLAIVEALNPEYGAFTVDTRTKMTWFQPGSLEPLWKFELIGMIFSLAVYNGLTLPITFPKALYQKLLDEEVTELHHIADGWPDLASGLTSLLEWDETKGLVEDTFVRTYEFSVEQFGETVSRDMERSAAWPQFSDPSRSPNPDDAPLVTNENRNRFVSDYILWLTDISVRPQMDAFKKGFFTVVNRRSTTLFDPQTLQSVVEGIQEIDITELRAHAMYEGWDPTHPSVRDFWSIVKRYDHEQKKKLLEFVTASDRVPVGGMSNLMFKLQKNGEGDGRLPTSATCFGALLMPMYSGKEIMREKLELALGNAQGFGNA